MPTRAPKLHFPSPGTGHHGAVAKREMAKRKAWHIVHAIDRIAGETFEQPIIQHGLRAASAFLGGLENEMYRAGEVAILRQHLRSTQQHGGMSIMPAGMHLAGMFRRIGKVGRFRQRQRIHIGAQPNGALAGAAAAQRANHAHATNPFHGFNAKAAQSCRDQRRGAGFLHAQFRMGVDVFSDGDQVRQDGRDFLHQGVVCHAVILFHSIISRMRQGFTFNGLRQAFTRRRHQLQPGAQMPPHLKFEFDIHILPGQFHRAFRQCCPFPGIAHRSGSGTRGLG